MSKDKRSLLFSLLATFTAVALGQTVFYAFMRAPTELRMGFVQKIFYFHVPVAYAMYIGATATAVGSIGYLLTGRRVWDAIARSGAELAVLYGLLTLFTGMLWGSKAWGHAWTWDPRLTTALLSTMIYVAYVTLRAFAGGGESESKFAAALGILGAGNLPIIHYSVKKWAGQHPTVITDKGGGLGHPAMYTALGLGFVTFTLMALMFLWYRTSLVTLEQRAEEIEEDAFDLGLDDESGAE